MNEITKRLMLPSLGDFIFVIVFLFLVRMLPHMLFSDGGTGWHLATGRFIAETGQIPYHDFMSYTFPNQPWITQYWLADVLMYAVQHSLGYNGLAVAFAACFASFFLLLYHQCRKEGAGALLVFVMVMLGAVVSTIQFLARPIVATWLMVGVFAFILENFQNNKLSTKYLLLSLFVCSTLWSNCHSGYIIGVTQIIIYAVYNLVPALTHSDAASRDESWRKSLIFGSASILSIIAATLNPYGFALHGNIFHILGNKAIIDSVEEFMSPAFHGGIQPTSLELLLGATIAAPMISTIRTSLPRALTVIAFIHLTLYAIRNAPLLVFIACPFIAHHCSQTRLTEVIGPPSQQVPRMRRVLDSFLERCKRMDCQEILNGYHLLPAIFVISFLIISANGGNGFGQQILDCGYGDQRYPVKTLASVGKLGLKPEEGFNQVNWGGYIFYETRMPIYIDDRANFFEDFYYRYGQIISLYPGWQDVLKADGINWVLYPKNSDFSNALKHDSQWRIADEDYAAYLFVRITPVTKTHSWPSRSIPGPSGPH